MYQALQQFQNSGGGNEFPPVDDVHNNYDFNDNLVSQVVDNQAGQLISATQYTYADAGASVSSVTTNAAGVVTQTWSASAVLNQNGFTTVQSLTDLYSGGSVAGTQSFTSNGSSASVALSGQVGTVNVSNATINASAGTTGSISGNNNTIPLTPIETLTISGLGNSAVLPMTAQLIPLSGAVSVSDGPNGTVVVQYGTSGSNGNTAIATINPDDTGTVSVTSNGQTTTQAFATAAQEYGEVGAAFGSALGRVLAGNNAFAQISTSTVLGALGEQVAAAIGVAGAGADAAQTINTFLNGYQTAGPNGGLIGNGGFLDSLESQGAGAVGAYLIGELVSAIGLTGAPAQIVDSLGGQTVAQIADNIITKGFSSWDSGIGTALTFENVAGGFIGTELGDLVYSADSVQGTEGASVGSAVGGALGALPAANAISDAIFGTVIPGFGVLIGAFVGDILGGLIGDLFGEPTTSAISLASLHAGGSSASGSLAFGAASGVAFNDLSFAQTGNDLTISVAGSSSQVTVAGWFANAYSQLQTITTTYDGVEITYYGSGLFASQHIGLGGGAFATETWQIGQAWTYYTSYYNAAGGLTEADFFTAPNQFLEKEVINPDGSYAWSYFGSSNNVVETDYYTSGNQRYQIDVNSANANVSASGIAVSVAAGVQGTIVTGTADTITAGSGSSVTVITNSGTDTINLTANSGSTVTLGTNSNAVINGAGNTINLSGPGNTLDAGGETVNVAANSLAVFNGSNNAIYAGSGDTIEITSGAGNVIYANGDTITLSAGVSATINGTANTVDSNNGTVTTIYDNGGGNTVNLAANSGATVIVSTDSNATVTGAGNTVDLSGPANTLDASGETVNLAANSLAVFYGDSNAIYAAGDDMIEINGGNNNIIYDAGNTVTLAAGLAATIVGNSNVLTMGSGDTVAVVNGAGEIINNDVAGNSVNLYSGASATVNGSGGYIGIVGTGISVTASYETINTIPSASFTIYGLGNTITLGSGSGVSVNDGGSDNTITLTANSGSTVIVGANSNAVVNGSGNSVELSGPANTLDASGETVSLVANALAVFYGSNNAIYAASGDTIEINTGTGNIINAAGGSNETVTLAGASDETVWFVQSGNDLRIDFMGTQNEVTIAGWFASTANKVQEVTAGGLKLDSQLSSLVAAMATYTAAHPGFDPTAVAQAPNDNALQTAIAAAWHS
jgi:hypothetical protein